jgi:hypothetical protein
MTDKDTLIDFTTIEKNLQHVHQLNLGVLAIPIDKIVGSIGRYQDFTDEFLPLANRTSVKYENIKKAMLSGKNLPAIKVYKILDNYFVIDGHHRVTVAKREMNALEIDAEVIDIHFDIELSPDKKYSYDTEQAKAFLIKLEENAFLNATSLRNDVVVLPLNVTNLNSFAKLFEEIKDFRKNYNNGEFAKRSMIYAGYAWYALRFLPSARIMISENILADFPNRTYTDLYVWIQEHKYFLSQKAGHDVGFDFTKEDFRKKFKKQKFLDVLPSIFHEIIRNIKSEGGDTPL